MQVTKVEMPSEDLTYKLSKTTLQPGEFADLELYLNPKMVHEVSGVMKIYTNSKLQPVVPVRIYAGIFGK